jgi:hypothetical protein
MWMLANGPKINEAATRFLARHGQTVGTYANFIRQDNAVLDELGMHCIARMMGIQIGVITKGRAWSTQLNVDLSCCKIVLAYVGQMVFELTTLSRHAKAQAEADMEAAESAAQSSKLKALPPHPAKPLKPHTVSAATPKAVSVKSLKAQKATKHTPPSSAAGAPEDDEDGDSSFEGFGPEDLLGSQYKGDGVRSSRRLAIKGILPKTYDTTDSDTDSGGSIHTDPDETEDYTADDDEEHIEPQPKKGKGAFHVKTLGVKKAKVQGRDYTCGVCDKKFRKSGDLTQHGKEHDTSYTCGVDGCGAKFLTTASLSRHTKLHGTTLLDCSECDMQFAYKSELKVHLLVHTKQRVYQCPSNICQKRYKTKGEYTRHMATHEGVDYECPEEGCTFVAVAKHLLKTHHRSKHVGLPCRVCNEVFDHPQKLANHRKNTDHYLK